MLSALVLSAFLQLGLVQGGSVLYTYPGEAYQSFPPLYATLGGKATWGALSVSGAVRTDVLKAKDEGFIPFQETYTFGSELVLKPFSIGWQHVCYHPLQVYMERDGYRITPIAEGYVDDFYIRVDIGAK